MNDCLGKYGSHEHHCTECLINEQCKEISDEENIENTEPLKLYNFFDEADNYLIFATNEYHARQMIRQDYGFEADYPLELWGVYEVKEGAMFTI